MDVTMRLELWHLVLAMFAFIGTVGFFAQILLAQIDKRLDARFDAQEAAREAGQDAWRSAFDGHLEAWRRETDVLHALEKDFLRFQGELPLQYVRREDFLRGQTLIEAKLDGLALKLENIQLRSNRT